MGKTLFIDRLFLTIDGKEIVGITPIRDDYLSYDRILFSSDDFVVKHNPGYREDEFDEEEF